MHYTLITYLSKLLRLSILMHYTLITYLSKLLRLSILMHYTLITYLSKPVEAEYFNVLHFDYLSF